ncbi:MAG TPA: zf-HC2 domain-containing protein [Streptosporangiaceae bacterium]|jgi:anti-sigma factor RsiW
MSHLGQRLSALIDGELDGEDRDRVLVHLAKCEPCRSEAVALRTLKRRMNALGGETETDSALTGRLIELAGLAASLDGRAGMGFASWSTASAARFGRAGWPEARPAWFVLGGAVSVFLAGLGTAAFMAGGSPQAPEPEPHVTPAVDVFLLQHDLVGGADPASPASPGLNRRTTPNVP